MVFSEYFIVPQMVRNSFVRLITQFYVTFVSYVKKFHVVIESEGSYPKTYHLIPLQVISDKFMFP